MSDTRRAPRRIPLGEGSITWVFPQLTDRDELVAVMDELRGADLQLGRLAQLVGQRSEARQADSPIPGLVYYRLGPEPEFPLTELTWEGWSDQLGVAARLWPPRSRRPGVREGPPWQAGAWIQLSCDVDPAGCTGHDVGEWVGSPVDSALSAARDLRAAVDWAFDVVTTQSEEALRERDPRRGHAIEPRARD